MHPQLGVREQNETARPRACISSPERFRDARRQCPTPRHTQPYKHQAVMRSRLELTNVRKVEVLRDEKPSFLLRGLPDIRVALAGQPFEPNVVNIMAQADNARTSDSGRFSSSLSFMPARAWSAPADPLRPTVRQTR